MQGRHNLVPPPHGNLFPVANRAVCLPSLLTVLVCCVLLPFLRSYSLFWYGFGEFVINLLSGEPLQFLWEAYPFAFPPAFPFLSPCL